MIRLVIARRPNQLQNRLLQMLKSLLLGTMAAVLMFIMATFLFTTFSFDRWYRRDRRGQRSLAL